MNTIVKYNTCKALSTALTVGTPIVTLACCGDFFIHRSDTAISAAAVFAFLLSLLFVKDKMLEFIKSPTALKVSVIGLVLLIVMERLFEPLKWVFGMTIAMSLVDEVSFKRMYNNAMDELGDVPSKYIKFGFICCTSEKLKELTEENNG